MISQKVCYVYRRAYNNNKDFFSVYSQKPKFLQHGNIYTVGDLTIDNLNKKNIMVTVIRFM